MTEVAVLMPSGVTDEWRGNARDFVEAWYARHVDAPVLVGECSGEWSKGAAFADALGRASSTADVLVLADADSFIAEPRDLLRSIEKCAAGSAWIVPHSRVYRLNAEETERLHREPTSKPRLGWTCRPMYYAVAGGGITVVRREAFEQVGGVDPRFLGWGGEDVAFGYALETLVGPAVLDDGQLVHLWHPHPAPDLRGSAESEALVAQYAGARGIPRRMVDVVAGRAWTPAAPLAEPVRFRMTANRESLRLPSGDIARFKQRSYETTDPDIVEQLRRIRIVREEPR